MFQTDLLSIVRCPVTVFTATGICHTSYVDCLLVEKQCILLASIIQIYHDTHYSECQNRSYSVIYQDT